MNEVQITCPLPGGTSPTADECDTVKNVSWSNPGVTNTNFFILTTDDTLVRFRFTPISNNGSNIVVKVIYGDDGNRVLKETFNLGQLPTIVDKYHVLNLGPGLRTNQVVTFETTTTLGTSGSFSILFDCEVSIGWMDFCYLPATKNPSDLCTDCPTIYRIFWDNQFTPVGFPQNEIFLNPELQTEAPVGFYRVLNNKIAPVVYYYDGNKLVKQTTCVNFIDCGNSVIISHKKGDYKYSTPYTSNFGDIQNIGNLGQITSVTNPKNLAYSVKNTVIWFPEPIYGQLTISLDINGGSFEDFGLIVYNANDPLNEKQMLSFGYTGLPFYKYTGPYTIIRKLKDRGTLTINVVFNANNAGSQALVASIIVGQKKRYKSNDVIQTTLFATCLSPLYKYIVGVHPYSSYDSFHSPKNTTELYSVKNINTWQVSYSEFLYNDPNLIFFALPWYYSYGTNVYKVGLPYLREFGTITSYQVKYSKIGRFLRWLTGKKQTVRVLEIKTDAINWILENNGFSCENCVEPQMTWGFLSEIIDEIDLRAPSQYFYFMGYGFLTDGDYGKRYSSNAFFSYYDYLEKKQNPIGGFRHSILYSPSVVPLIGYNQNLPGPDWYYYPWYNLPPDIYNASLTVGTALLWSAIIYSAIDALVAALKPALDTVATYTPGKYAAIKVAAQFCPDPTVCVVILAAIIATIILIDFFKIRTINYPANCNKFAITWTTTPYVEVGTTIYHDRTFANIYNYYYCDGPYFYTQNSGSVISKETATYLDTKTKQTLSVVPIPDDPSHITSVLSLYFLCYTAGRPDLSFDNFKNFPIETTVNKTNYDGELLQQNPITYSIPEGQFTSSISQEDADNQAYLFMTGMTGTTTYQSLMQKPNVGIQTITFTHELKNEIFPSTFEVAFDDFDLSGLTVGKKIYYDDDGFFSVLNGFYSIFADDNLNYKFFYQTSAGTIIDKWIMSATSATNVISQETSQVQNLNQTNLDYTSSWYFTSQQQDNLYNLFAPDSLFISSDTWNSESFYSSPSLVRGFINSPNTKESFYLFNSNINLNSYSSATEAYYAEVPTVYNPEVFSFVNSQILTLNIVQECSETEYLNGVRVICYNQEGFESPAYNGVEFVLNLYINANVEGYNQVLTYNLTITNSQYDVFQQIETSLIGRIVDGEISTIISTNPTDNFLYSAGTFTSCNTPTPTPTPITWTVTPTESNTPTPTKTPTNTPTPTITPSSGGINCDEYYNNTSNPLTGINYTDCNGIEYTNITVNAGDGICVLEGTLNGGDSGFLTNLGTCGRYYPSATPTPTTSQTPSFTPTQSVTSTSQLPFTPISLSTAQVTECNSCGLTSYSVTGYTSPFDSVPTSGDTVYSNSSGTLLFNGAGQWFKTSWGSPFAQFSIRINSLGIVTGVVNCATCATNTPTPSVTPTYTPTYSETPTNTPTYPETPTNTPTYTETPTPTASGVPCYEYTATASQSDIDASDDGTVYFQYIDCITGSTQIVTRGVADVPSNAVCARSIGSIYIIVSGNQSPASSSSWSLPGASC